MVVDDIMEHIRQSHSSIEAALDKTRAIIAREYSRPSYHKIRLSPSEVAASIDDILVGDFFERYPHYRDYGFIDRTKIIGKLDKFKEYMFLTQYSPRMQDVIQQFRFECRLVSEQYHVVSHLYVPLLRCLDRASISALHLKDQAPYLKSHAIDVLGKLHEDYDPVVVRLMLEIVGYCDVAVKHENVSRSAHSRHVAAIAARPANDNSMPAAAWSL